MIVLLVPETGSMRLDDDVARSLAERLWAVASRAGTALIAVSIEQELGRQDVLRNPIIIGPSAATVVAEALVGLDGSPATHERPAAL